MSSPTLEQTRVALIARIGADGIFFEPYYRYLGFLPTDEDGSYSPAPYGRPSRTIFLARDISSEKPGEAAHEVPILAHEYGHALSDSRGLRTELYGSAVALMRTRPARLRDEQKAAVLDEETRAWRFGRETLVDLEFSDWSLFDAAERDGLSVYREKLWT